MVSKVTKSVRIRKPAESKVTQLYCELSILVIANEEIRGLDVSMEPVKFVNCLKAECRVLNRIGDINFGWTKPTSIGYPVLQGSMFAILENNAGICQTEVGFDDVHHVLVKKQFE
jgi:hypothetical protein